MVMQYVSGGELFDYVQSSGHLKEEQVCAIMRHILDAVAYLHARNIVHRDLKLVRI
jgi:serine/threonine protein kinase